MPERLEFSGFLEMHEDGRKDVGVAGWVVTPGLTADSVSRQELRMDVCCAVVMDTMGVMLSAAYAPKDTPQILVPAGPVPNLRMAD